MPLPLRLNYLYPRLKLWIAIPYPLMMKKERPTDR